MQEDELQLCWRLTGNQKGFKKVVTSRVLHIPKEPLSCFSEKFVFGDKEIKKTFFLFLAKMASNEEYVILDAKAIKI